MSYKVLDGFHYISRTFLLREDISERKVYLTFIDLNGPREWLLYDFSLNVNDIMDVYNPVSPFPLYSGEFQVDSIIFQPLVDENLYRHFYLHALDTIQSGGVKNTIWIEGVGSTSLINAPGGDGNVNEAGKLSCFFKDGTLFYNQMDSISSCIPTFFPNGEENDISFELNVFPTFAQSEIHVFSELEIATIKIFDIKGILVKTYKIENEKFKSLLIDDLSEGIYILDIKLSNLHHKKVKFFKTN
jgi:hypothetical protein